MLNGLKIDPIEVIARGYRISYYRSFSTKDRYVDVIGSAEYSGQGIELPSHMIDIRAKAKAWGTFWSGGKAAGCRDFEKYFRIERKSPGWFT
jgi:hypothetical protein